MARIQHKKISQRKQILEALEQGRKITSLDALGEWGCFRLAPRIMELRREGYDIIGRTIKSGNDKHFTQYWLVGVGND